MRHCSFKCGGALSIWPHGRLTCFGPCGALSPAGLIPMWRSFGYTASCRHDPWPNVPYGVLWLATATLGLITLVVGLRVLVPMRHFHLLVSFGYGGALSIRPLFVAAPGRMACFGMSAWLLDAAVWPAGLFSVRVCYTCSLIALFPGCKSFGGSLCFLLLM